MKIIAIIPARGGSKRIKNKNILMLGYMSLIERTIHAAKNSKLITDIYVSTDSSAIRNIAKQDDVIVVERPLALCGDYTPSENAVRHVLNHIGSKPDIIVMMQCTSPFRLPGQIDKGIKKLISSEADSLFFGAYLDKWIWTHDGKKSINYDYKHRKMTQQKEWELVECGDYVFTRESFLKYNNRLGGKIEHHIVDKLCAFDINTKEDYEIAKVLADSDMGEYI